MSNSNALKRTTHLLREVFMSTSPYRPTGFGALSSKGRGTSRILVEVLHLAFNRRTGQRSRFITSGARLGVASLFSNPRVLAMVSVYTLRMRVVRGLPALRHPISANSDWGGQRGAQRSVAP